MKTILLTCSASLALILSSCQTLVPVNPNCGKPACNMLPCGNCPHGVTNVTTCSNSGCASSCSSKPYATK